MLKLSVSYSKKLPVPGQEFSSESCHAALEVELSEGLPAEQLHARIHEHFQIVRRSVEDELRGNAQAPAPQFQGQPPASQFQGQPGNNGQTASPKQVRFLLDLGAKQHKDLHTLNAEIHQRFGVDNVYALSKQQASKLIDELTGKTGRSGRAA